MGKRAKEDDLFLKKLGKRIATIRKAQHITQVELGDRCDIEKPNMARLESGGTNPTVLTLKKISKALNIPLSELLAIDNKD
jgi:transcriptional regulator with XRE-family HTH domain